MSDPRPTTLATLLRAVSLEPHHAAGGSHLVKAIQGERLQIGNNRGGINGWVTRRQIFGRLITVDD